MPKARTFTALLEPDGTKLRWTIARLPFDLAKAWPERNGRRVRGTVNGFAFRTSLFPDPIEAAGSGKYILLVNKKMQAGAGARQGDRVRITLEPDMEERQAVVPEELAHALRECPGLRKWFDQMSPSMRHDIGKFVGEPRTAASRIKRAEEMAERLQQTMEGEQDAPPLLRAAFARQPLAEAGWKALTPVQRRNHLLGIFNYRTAEGREKRAQKAIEDCLRSARKRREAAGREP